MKRSHLHLISAACLMAAIWLTWTSQNQATPPPPEPQLSQRTLTPKPPSKPPRKNAWKPEPYFESSRLSYTGGYFILKASTLEDLKTALAEVSALPPSSSRDHALAQIFKRLANADPEFAKQKWLAWEHALTEPWLEAASAICLALAKDDPFAPSDFITQHLPRTAQIAAWEPILRTMESQAATQVLANFPPTKRRFDLTKSVSIEWMKTDPEACALWLDSLIPSLTEEQRETLKDCHGAFSRSFETDPDPLEIRLATFRQAQNTLAREYLASLVLETDRITEAQKAAFLDELADALPDYHAALTAPPNNRSKEYYHTPEKFAEALKPADFRNLSSYDQSTLIARLSNTNPGKAVDFIIKMEAQSSLSFALYRWYQVAPREAIDYAKSIPATRRYQLDLFNFAMSTAHFVEERDTLQLIELIQSPERRQEIRDKLADKKE